jgi:FkbM family methyltransferase
MLFFYKVIYNPSVNLVLRSLLKPLFQALNKELPISISGKLTLNYRDKTFHLYTNQTCSVTQELFSKGCDSYEFTPLFEHLIKRSTTFFDVGANIGYFSILAGKLNATAKIFAFEPSRGPKHYLSRNVISNNLKNVKVIEKAVAEVAGTMQFFEVVNDKFHWVKHQLSGSHSLQNQFGLSKKKQYNVATTTLNAVIDENNLKQLDLIKLDTECTEHQILRNSIDTINMHQPIIICEVYPVIQDEVQQVINLLSDYGIYHYQNQKLKQIKSFKELDGNSEEDRNFIFCPKSKAYLIWTFVIDEVFN